MIHYCRMRKVVRRRRAERSRLCAGSAIGVARVPCPVPRSPSPRRVARKRKVRGTRHPRRDGRHLRALARAVPRRTMATAPATPATPATIATMAARRGMSRPGENE